MIRSVAHGSLLIEVGTPVEVVSERLGHANIAFTMQTYQHVLPDVQADAATATERLAKPKAAGWGALTTAGRRSEGRASGHGRGTAGSLGAPVGSGASSWL